MIVVPQKIMDALSPDDQEYFRKAIADQEALTLAHNQRVHEEKRFAAAVAAMQGIITDGFERSATLRARYAVEHADALLYQLAKSTEQAP